MEGNKLLVAAIASLMAGLILSVGYYKLLQWDECRAAGLSKFYCFEHIR